ncbi:hypothetical protein EVAR_76351_1 [Eumeta japonica]|uniref:Uncharacterized protein n=1 Tax=Eumeta variegata TaxID=151549 RepID=A0A4C1T7L8_EUMVA|nr:hypothetical protein EVAR_76351_1 [Eumeta japonica]
MSIYYALAGWSGKRERRDERTKRKRGKEKDGGSYSSAVGVTRAGASETQPASAAQRSVPRTRHESRGADAVHFLQNFLLS